MAAFGKLAMRPAPRRVGRQVHPGASNPLQLREITTIALDLRNGADQLETLGTGKDAWEHLGGPGLDAAPRAARGRTEKSAALAAAPNRLERLPCAPNGIPLETPMTIIVREPVQMHCAR